LLPILPPALESPKLGDAVIDIYNHSLGQAGNGLLERKGREVEYFLKEEVLMRKSKFTDSQIVDPVKRVKVGLTLSDICRELGVSTATFCKWRAKSGGMGALMMSRMKEFEKMW
jgi:hypothetical protein